VHCVEETDGAGYHDALDTALITDHVRKGQGVPAYSMFQAVDEDGVSMSDLLSRRDIDAVDVVGIASDYCCLATARDAIAAGLATTVLTDLQAGVSPASTAAAYEELAHAGAAVTTSKEIS
jgi:nicotinamidase/pyrazinamidase